MIGGYTIPKGHPALHISHTTNRDTNVFSDLMCLDLTTDDLRMGTFSKYMYRNERVPDTLYSYMYMYLLQYLFCSISKDLLLSFGAGGPRGYADRDLSTIITEGTYTTTLYVYMYNTIMYVWQ